MECLMSSLLLMRELKGMTDVRLMEWVEMLMQDVTTLSLIEMAVLRQVMVERGLTPLRGL
jgi:hypothetical protein